MPRPAPSDSFRAVADLVGMDAASFWRLGATARTPLLAAVRGAHLRCSLHRTPPLGSGVPVWVVGAAHPIVADRPSAAAVVDGELDDLAWAFDAPLSPG